MLPRFLLPNTVGLERNKGRKKGFIFYALNYRRRKLGKGEEVAHLFFLLFVCMWMCIAFSLFSYSLSLEIRKRCLHLSLRRMCYFTEPESEGKEWKKREKKMWVECSWFGGIEWKNVALRIGEHATLFRAISW